MDASAVTFEKGYAAGVKAGYMEAVCQVWEYTHSMKAADSRTSVIQELQQFLAERRSQAIESCINPVKPVDHEAPVEDDLGEAWEAEHPNGDPISTR